MLDTEPGLLQPSDNRLSHLLVLLAAHSLSTTVRSVCHSLSLCHWLVYLSPRIFTLYYPRLSLYTTQHRQ
jgi:hypothetical protein